MMPRALLASSAAAVLLVLGRIGYTGERTYLWLILPNLALAWVPLIMALLVGRARSLAAQVALGGVWLLFLPNAPYILTDYVHLTWVPNQITIYYDVAMLGAVAVTGLYLGFLSMMLMQERVARALGAHVGWIFAVSCWGLTSVGIYLGRVPRFNSWDILHAPWRIVATALSVPAEQIPMLLGFALALLALYLPFWAMARGRGDT